MSLRFPFFFVLFLAGCAGGPDETGKTTESGEDVDGDGYEAAEDCDEEDPEIHPDASERCDRVDNDCDGAVDEDATDALTLYVDADQDGYGDDTQPVQSCSIGANALVPTDCDDEDPSRNPGIEETCDGIDNNCDEAVDEAGEDYYPDADGDGYGGEAGLWEGCEKPEGYIETGGDCDDATTEVSPDADESCDEIDNNCDGNTDEAGAVDAPLWYPDGDGDGDASLEGEAFCEAPEGYSAAGGDCDDADAEVYSGAERFCGSRDADCDGVDDGVILVPEDYGTVQEAVDASVDGFLICLEAGEYEETVDFAGKAIHVVGADRDTTVITGSGTMGPVVTFHGAEGADTILEGVTITGGLAFSGAGILIEEASPTLVDVTVEGNYCGGAAVECRGTGLLIDGGAPNLSGVIVSNNSQVITESAYALGAGMAVIGGATATVTDLTVENNGAACGGGGAFDVSCWGGGLAITEGSAMTVEGLVVSGNSVAATGDEDIRAGGGGLYLADGASLIVPSNTDLTVYVQDNVVSADDSGIAFGGGALVDGSTLVLYRVLFASNTVRGPTAVGAGIAATQAADVDIVNAAFLGNVAGDAAAVGAFGGGAYAEAGSRLAISYAVLAGNDAEASSTDGEAEGGAIWVDAPLSLDGVVLFANTVTAANASGGAIAIEVDSGDVPSIVYSDVYGNTSSELSNVPSLAASNLSVDPAFVDVTAADPADWDLHLLAGSPLIDMGNPSATDGDGTRSDMGAYGGPNGWP